MCVVFFYFKFYELMTKRCKRACACACALYNVRNSTNSEKKCDELGTVLFLFFFFSSQCRPTAPLAAISRLFNAELDQNEMELHFWFTLHAFALKLYRNTTQRMNELNQFRIRWHTTKFFFIFLF